MLSIERVTDDLCKTGDVGEGWLVFRTRSRHEKILAGELAEQGIPVFLPLTSCTLEYAGKPARVELPVFPGFLFVHGDVTAVQNADRNGRIVGRVEVADSNELAKEITLLIEAEARKMRLSLRSVRLSEGATDVTSNPEASTLRISAIGQSVIVESAEADPGQFQMLSA